MFVATKYEWIHCYQIPQWCNVYCQFAGHSQVAMITGGPNAIGMGNAALFTQQAEEGRISTIIVPLTTSELSAGVLSQFDLVILDQMQQISFMQALTLKNYVDQGGSILWMGDAATNYVSNPNDNALALAQNKSQPGYYEAYMKFVNQSGGTGFGLLGNYLGAQYISENTNPVSVSINQLIPSNPIVSGLLPAYAFTTPYVSVAQVPQVTTEVATLQVPGGTAVPAILDRKYVGRIVYVAFPVENANSPTLTQNLLDYLVQC
jgi:hypothetical protein